jgi:hypothetical protein
VTRQLNWVANLCINGSIEGLKAALDSYSVDVARRRREQRPVDPSLRALENIHGRLEAAYAFRTSDASRAGRLREWAQLVESGLGPDVAVMAVEAIHSGESTGA